MKLPFTCLLLSFVSVSVARAELPVSTAPVLDFAFEELVALAANETPGPTAMGGRNIVPITGGTFEGPGIKGTIIPGGWDWQLRRADGCLSIKADYMLKTDDGAVINVVNQGISCPAVNGKRDPTRTSATFEPPIGKYEWLGKSIFVGTLEPVEHDGGRAVRIRFYRAH